MVDLFSGDFSYNIPLFELPGPNGGYPFNLVYQSGIGMDTEASWVGLGFNLQPGSINRQMRGLPDEFKGDIVKTKMSIKPDVTVGLEVGANFELVGKESGKKGKARGGRKKKGKGGFLSKFQPSLGVGVGARYNNYRGFGYSISSSIGLSRTSNTGITDALSLDVSLDSREGVGVNPSLGLGTKIGVFGLAAGYNSKTGLHSVTFSHHEQRPYMVSNSKGQVYNYSASAANNSSALTLAPQSYTPQLGMPMRTISISGTFKAGAGMWAIFGSGYLKGFFVENHLKDDGEEIGAKAFGYLNYQYRDDAGALVDLNREKDGMVSKESPNLPIPSLTYDIYTAAGHGMSGMYRAMRNDYGVVNDPEVQSNSTAGGIGVDVGPPAHWGVNLTLNHSKSVTGGWSDSNHTGMSFKKEQPNTLFEPWHFKVHGEYTSENAAVLSKLGGDKAVRIKLGSKPDPNAQNIIESDTGEQPVPQSASLSGERKNRNQVIQPITNEQLLGSNNEEILPLFNISYFENNGSAVSLDRSKYPTHHTAGFTALTADGMRYVYGIPAYNHRQEEVTFTAMKQTSNETSRVNVNRQGEGDPYYQYPGSRKFLKSVKLPPYAHSYLLTSVVGPDYVDLTGNGVTDDDLGYWVKFTYKRTTTQSRYKWRDPYSKAHFQDGWKTAVDDDQGHFTFGEKDLWYLAQAETKSHVAKFIIEPRNDARGAFAKLQDTNQQGEPTYRLKEIRLFTRSANESYVIKKVKFNYEYALCKKVYNNINNGGKLTLKRLWFEYGNSDRGSLNPYIFDYHENNPAENPDYDQHAYDRWGNYKPYLAGDFLHNENCSYTEQDPLKKAEIDRNAAVWSLKEIRLPSGGKVIIDYESDDYAYVQHKQAMQMTSIVDPYTAPTGTLRKEFIVKQTDYKIRFKLEKPLDPVLDSLQQRAEVMKYLDDQSGQVSFKLLINLRSSSENFYEYINGYADIDFSKTMKLEADNTGKYVYGYFYLKGEYDYHPFSMRAWQHLRTNQPELTGSDKKLEPTTDNGERASQIKSLAGILPEIRKIFTGFYQYCHDNGWGKEIDAERSWIRLKSPDKIKFGGGLRVRQITMQDQWKYDKEGVYGQVYEYTIQEAPGAPVISSGVAAYEPIIGGEENSLRYFKRYVQTVPLRTDNNLYFEFPINESYYPGPHVGYRKVTVTSLAAAALAGMEVKHIDLASGRQVIPHGEGVTYGTTGMTVHEFYTAKEFPVLTYETEKKNIPEKISAVVPFIGGTTISKLTASQGYSIVTNDMHGKPRKVSNYRQDQSGKIAGNPISWVEYKYKADTITYQQERVMALSNIFKDNSDGTLSEIRSGETAASRSYMGQETEFFADMREFDDLSWGGGTNINTDVIILPIIAFPLPSWWPNINKTRTRLRTVVTNKIIFRAGIQVQTDAFDGGSTVSTRNLKWDKQTGVCVLTSVNNNFDAPVYSYTIPAYTKYAGMGGSYRNIGLVFNMTIGSKDTDKHTYEFNSAVVDAALTKGDEVLLFNSGDNAPVSRPVAFGIVIDKEDGMAKLYCKGALTETSYKAMVVRSGYRNQLTVAAGTITALEDPSTGSNTHTYTKVITVPKQN